MIRFFTVVTLISAIWFWIIITWVHVTIQAISLNGYVYQPYKKYPSIVRKPFIVIFYPFCCKPITDQYEIKLVPVQNAYKRLLVTTLLWSLVTFVGISVERERLKWRYNDKSKRKSNNLI